MQVGAGEVRAGRAGRVVEGPLAPCRTTAQDGRECLARRLAPAAAAGRASSWIYQAPLNHSRLPAIQEHGWHVSSTPRRVGLPQVQREHAWQPVCITLAIAVQLHLNPVDSLLEMKAARVGHKRVTE